MFGELTTFASVLVGATFMCNGNACHKVSTRTARLIQYDRVFYFGMKENVTLGTPGEGDE